MTTIVTVKYLADEKMTTQIREQLEQKLKDQDSRVSVLGSANSDNLEIKVSDLDGNARHLIKKISINATADQIVNEAVRMASDDKDL